MTTMLAIHPALEHLHRFEADMRANTFTGSLLGLGLPERDRVLAAEFERFEAELEQATAKAKATGEPVVIDGARISLTESGDAWRIMPDGRMEREYSQFDGFEQLVASLGNPPELDPSRAIAPNDLYRVAYHGFWSPSATNWQPTRVVELNGPAKARLFAQIGWTLETELPALVLLRRDHYESLLGDVLEPYGLAVTAREESIDAGIFAETLAMSALSRGLTYREHVFAPGELSASTALLREVLDERRAALTGDDATAVAELSEALGSGKYLLDSVMVVGHAREGMAVSFERFDELMDAHSTQRVASPTREFSKEETDTLWARTVAALPAHERACVDFVFFHWSHQTPPMIGSAMFEALYGAGADPEAKTGGEGGLLTAVSVRNYLQNLAKKDPAYVASVAGDNWQELSDAELQKATRQVGLRAADIGPYLRERILRDGKYMVVDGVIQDAAGKPLSIPVLVRLNKSLASTFGNFFLKFQNTHPQNGVILANTAAGESHWVYRSVGKASAVLTYMARAMGASSIIKTGPIDLARDPISQILANNPDAQPEVTKLQPAIAAGTVLPAMTFQVGYPLAGSDIIEPGTPNEHSGYEERKRDKRPPRARFVSHYFPAL
ncbi:hypothetical protein J7643_03535 [bacterium]|nr:hypothetical protein [bacterium]